MWLEASYARVRDFPESSATVVRRLLPSYVRVTLLAFLSVILESRPADVKSSLLPSVCHSVKVASPFFTRREVIPRGGPYPPDVSFGVKVCWEPSPSFHVTVRSAFTTSFSL